MAFTGSNPKMVAWDIADGYVLLTAATIRKYNPPQLKMLSDNMTIVERTLRQEHYEPEDVENIKKKHMRMQRLFRARTLIQTHCKKWKITL
jgi:hypothetical protein